MTDIRDAEFKKVIMDNNVLLAINSVERALELLLQFALQFRHCALLQRSTPLYLLWLNQNHIFAFVLKPCPRSRTCGKHFSMIKLSDELKNYILQMHNDVRHSVAEGIFHQIPPASNMNFLVNESL